MIKVMEWLLLLLEQPGPIIPSARTCYTATQVRIAKTAEALITENLAVHYSAKELSKRFHISETSLKNYFRGVFGQSYSAYQREIRMKTAASSLCDPIPVSCGRPPFIYNSKSVWKKAAEGA